MKSYRKVLCSIIIMLALLASAIDSEADGPTAVQVFTVDTHGNTDAYIAALKPLIDILEELSPEAAFDVFEATFAGEQTGTIYVVIRYPDMVYLAESNERSNNSETWVTAFRKLAATGRTLRRSEILEDRTPR